MILSNFTGIRNWKQCFNNQKIFYKSSQALFLTLHITNHPFFITVDSSSNVIGCVLFQINEKKLLISSYSSRIFINNEQHLCTTCLEFMGSFFSSTFYGYNIFDSDHFITVLKDHKTVSIGFKRTVSPQSQFSDLSRSTNLFVLAKNSSHSSNATLIVEIEIQEACGSAPFKKIIQKLR